jgi:phosphoribosyl 1,2-cyclic phosphodiesterase
MTNPPVASIDAPTDENSPDDIIVEYWGTRGSIPTPGLATQRYGGNSSCVALRFGRSLFICDGGTGIRALGQELTRLGGPPVRAHLFFSHSHWDHIQGFPFFTPAYDPRARITVYGNHAGPGCMYDLLSGQMQAEYFPVSFRDLGAQITGGALAEPEGSIADPDDPASVALRERLGAPPELALGRAAAASIGMGRVPSAPLREDGVIIDGVRVRVFRGRHPGGSVAYRFESGGVSVVYCTDNELDAVLLNRAESLSDPARMRRAPLDFVDFVAGADLLIGDAQYTDQEYPKKVGWGHSRANTVVDLSVQAEVQRVALYHHDPLQTDAMVDWKVDGARARALRHGESRLEVSGARERVQIKLR